VGRGQRRMSVVTVFVLGRDVQGFLGLFTVA
jgi:hypothetical protein